MIESLYPLTLPPGLHHIGTVYQSKDRWHAGNLVRFYQGTIQPVGGWVQRTLTGATISGIPNAAISWQTNDGNSYLAIGTTTNLYIVSSANVVYDITPATLAGDGITHLWQLETFGLYLVAVFARPSYVDTAVINAFVWRGVLSTAASAAYDSTTGPGSVFGVTVTPERFLVLLRGADPTAFVADTAAGGGTSGGAGGTTGTDGSGGVSGGGGGGAVPAETGPTATVTTGVTVGRASAAWANTNHTASLRVEWSISTASGGAYTVDQTDELSAETSVDRYANTDGPWVKVRMQYFNATGAGAWGSYSTPRKITTTGAL